MEIEIKKYGPEWESAHIDFATEYFNGRRKRIHPTYLYWKFRGDQGKEMKSFIVAVEDDRVVGQLGLIPCTVAVANQHFEAQWACDLMVHSDYRGKGVAKKLYEVAVNRKITLGSDPSPKAAVSMAKFGFKNIDGPIKTFLPLKLAAITDKKIKSLSKYIGKVNYPLAIGSRKNMQWLLSSETNVEDLDFDEIKALKSDACASIVHDREFFLWRLSAFKNYQNQGQCFFRKNTFFVTIRVSGSILFVNDLFIADNKYFKKVMSGITKYAKIKGLSEIKWMENDISRIKFLKRSGFLTYKRRTNIIYFSHDKTFNSLVKKCNQFFYNSLDSDENI